MRFPKQVISFVTVAGTALSISACNTVEGVGEDVRAAGGAIDNSAEETRNYDADGRAMYDDNGNYIPPEMRK